MFTAAVTMGKECHDLIFLGEGGEGMVLIYKAAAKHPFMNT